MILRLILLQFLYLFFTHFTFAQCPSALSGYVFYNIDTLLKLERNALKGNVDALVALSNYMGDTSKVPGRLGFHHLTRTKGNLARQMVKDATCFQTGEFNWDNSTDDIIANIKRLSGRLYFDSSVCMYLITPLEGRQELADNRNLIIGTKEIMALNPTEQKLQDPGILLEIAKAMYIKRHEYHQIKHYTDAIELLTGCNIGVAHNSGTLFFHDDEFRGTDDAAIYLVYWENHFRDYQYDDVRKMFINNHDTIYDVSKIYDTYMCLYDTSDLNQEKAFVQLTEAKPDDIAILNQSSDDIQGFAKSFLQQLSFLTAYCRIENIQYNKPNVREYCNGLYGYRDYSYSQFIKDDSLANTMDINDITSFEYWSIVNSLFYSRYYGFGGCRAGSIIDKFYDKNWKSILNDKRQLSLYLKKSYLYSHLGIIGACNYYLYKFNDADHNTIVKLKQLASETKDTMINTQIQLILNSEVKQKYRLRDTAFVWNDLIRQSYFSYASIHDTLAKVMTAIKPGGNKKENLLEVCCKATYSQLDTAINALLEIDDYEHINQLIQCGFGITINRMVNKRDVTRFIGNYHTMNMEQLYAHYLRENGIDIWNNGEIDYQKAYYELKYRRPLAFTGGNSKDMGCSAIALLLRLHFGENLGLPDKAIQYSYGFSGITDFSALKREKWMKYLLEKQLVEIPAYSTSSFSDESFF